MDPVKVKLQRITDFYGSMSEMDPQGRVLIPSRLRESAQLSGDVVVYGKIDHLEVWNEQVASKDVEENPLTLEDRERLAELGF